MNCCGEEIRTEVFGAGGMLGGFRGRSDEARVGIWPCDTRLKFCLWSLLCPSNRWATKQGALPFVVRQGGSCLKYQALPCHQRLSIGAGPLPPKATTVSQGSTTVLYSTYLPTVPSTGCTNCSA